jgi:putative hydrolase of the HAD superfamily
MKPKYVVFDLDGTLYDYDLACKYGLSQLFIFLGAEFKISKVDLEEMFKKAKATSKNQTNLTAESHNLILYIIKMFEIYKIPLNLELIVECENVYWSNFISRIEPYEKLEEFIIDLKSIGTNLVLITDMSAKIQIRKLIALNLDKVFDIFISSDRIGGDKITGKPFKYLNELVDLTEENVWYIGDNAWDLNLNDSISNARRFKKGILKTIDSQHGVDITTFNEYEELRNLL